MNVSILVVDDDPIFGGPLCQRLEKCKEFNATTEYAESGGEALSLAQNPEANFDIFLIDQRLDVDFDGFELIDHLKEYHPNSDFLMFTGIPEEGDGSAKKAYQAGAHRYLRKPFRFSELKWMIQSLLEKRENDKERNWLEILLKIGEHSQTVSTNEQLAEILTQAGQSFGFARSRFYVRNTDTSLLCIQSYGHKPDLKGQIREINSNPCTKKAEQKRGAFFFLGINREPENDFEKFLSPPKGEWALLSLGIIERCEAILVLDHGEESRSLKEEEKHFLGLLNQQANASLLHLKEKRQSYRFKLLNELGAKVNEIAVVGNLTEVLEVIQKIVYQGISAPNLIVSLKDEFTEEIHNEVHYVNNISIKNNKPRVSGMIKHIIQQEKTIFLPYGTKEYREKHNIPLLYAPAESWMGVPLKVGGQTIGAIVLEDDHRKGSITKEEQLFVEAVAELAAGAVQTVRLKKKDEKAKEQLRLLHYASAQILRFSNDPEKLWAFVLTVMIAVCDQEAVDWMMFLDRNGRSVYFKGTFGLKSREIYSKKYDKYWQNDLANFDLDKFTNDLTINQFKSKSAFNHLVKNQVNLNAQKISQLQPILNPVQNNPLFATRDEAKIILGNNFKKFDSLLYAAIPVKSAPNEPPIGLLLMGGKRHLKKSTPFNHLESLLLQVALAIQAKEEQLFIDNLNKAQSDFLSFDSSSKPKTLQELLCKVAQISRQMIQSDRVAIHPFQYKSVHFDSEQYGYDIESNHDSDIPGQARSNGFSRYVIQKGIVSIQNIDEDNLPQINVPLKTENRGAVIGMRIMGSASNQPLGVFYADYRYPQQFDQYTFQRVQLAVNLAGETIQNYYAKKNLEESRLRELQYIEKVQNDALNVRLLNGEDLLLQLVPSLIQSVIGLIDDPATVVRLLLPSFTTQKKRQYLLDDNNNAQFKLTNASLQEGLTGIALQTGRTQYIPNVNTQSAFIVGDYGPLEGTLSELDVPIKINNKILGIWNLESPIEDAFSEQQIDAVERFANTTAVVIDNIDRYRHRKAMLEAAKSINSTLTPKESIAHIGKHLFDALPIAETITVWYRTEIDEETDNFELGYIEGVSNEEKNRQKQGGLPKTDLIQTTLKRGKPKWIENIDSSDIEQFKGDFNERENIKSTVHYPLISDNNIVGVMFLGYRQLYKFSNDEKLTISIFAEILASCIRDAVNFDNLRLREKQNETLLNLANAVGDKLEETEALKIILEQLNRLFSDSNMIIHSYDRKRNILNALYASTPFYTFATGVHQNEVVLNIEDESEGLICEVGRRSRGSGEIEILNVPDVSQPPFNRMYKPTAENMHSSLSMGFANKRGLLGTIGIESPRKKAFSKKDEQFLLGVGKIISAVMTRIEQKRELDFKNMVSSRTAWTAEVAHESQSEIGKILFWLRWLRDEAKLSDTLRSYIDDIETSIKQVSLMMDDPVEAGFFKEERSLYCLHDYLQSVLDRISSKKGYQIEFCLSQTDMGTIQTNAPKNSLKRITSYLVHNSIESIEKKYKKNHDEIIRDGIITVDAICVNEQHAQSVKISVTDNGLGIAPELRERILEEPIVDKNRPKRGYGLMFARMFVDGMSGELWLDSEINEPVTRFSFRIPLNYQSQKDL